MNNFKFKIVNLIWFIFSSALILAAENFVFIKNKIPFWANIILILLASLAFVFFNIHPIPLKKIQSAKLHHSAGGVFLLKVFLFTSVIISSLFLLSPLCFPFENFTGNESYLLNCIHIYRPANLIFIYFTELVIFWNGIIRVYIFSSQVSIKLKIIGIICGMIFPVNLIILFIIIKKADNEIFIESTKEEVNSKRKDKQVCKTKYPVVLIHGVFFRDFNFFNYWGRIPKELEKNGASIYYGNQESANSVKKTGIQLAQRIKDILKESGAKKVNIIAHSKGGLDCRYMISKCGMEDYVASLTTINTPHRGCEFADYLLCKTFSERQKELVASAYNAALKKIGDKEPDFISSVTDLTSTACRAFNEEVKDSPKVFYQSVGSKLNRPQAGKFPLNFSYLLVKKFDGPNDGLVGEKSFEWGSRFIKLETKGRRGISHGDVIDLNRENIPGFDVREFYVQLLSELKDKGF